MLDGVKTRHTFEKKLLGKPCIGMVSNPNDVGDGGRDGAIGRSFLLFSLGLLLRGIVDGNEGFRLGWLRRRCRPNRDAPEGVVGDTAADALVGVAQVL